MNDSIRIATLAASIGAAAAGGLGFAADADRTTPAPLASSAAIDDGGAIAIAPWRRALLRRAGGIAASIPLEPHVKDRALAQAGIVAGWLELDDPGAALDVAESIPNWRRGEACATIALRLAERGEVAGVPGLLGRAELDAELAEGWRRDRIHVAVARVRVKLGEDEAAARLEIGLTESEAGKVDAIRAERATPEECDRWIEELDALVLVGSMDRLRNATEAGVALLARFHDDPERRGRIEAAIRAAWRPLPIMVRLDVLLGMADAAIDDGDRARAMALVVEAEGIVAAHGWLVEHRLPIVARIAERRGLAGDVAGARAALQAAIAQYDADASAIVDIWRAGALRPVAEACAATGDPATALEVYRRAIDAGALNPNARPRAMDLAATLASMAVHGVAPDEAMTGRIDAIAAGLRAPW